MRATEEDCVALWRQLVADPLTANDFAAAALPAVAARLAAKLPRAHPDDVATAAGDALLAFLKRPEAFDPARCGLLAYLTFVARRDYLNQFDREQRHHRGRIPWNFVELDPPGRNEGAEGDGPTFDSPALRAAVAALSETDRRVLALMREGERGTAAFAAVLDLSAAAAAEQEAAVKRAKDRIKVYLKRAVGGSDG